MWPSDIENGMKVPARGGCSGGRLGRDFVPVLGLFPRSRSNPVSDVHRRSSRGLYVNTHYHTAMAEIVRTEGVLGGDPRIDGTRIGVLHVHELVARGNHSPVDVADQLGISLGEVYSALAYYHEHPGEMREVRRSHEDAESDLREESVSPPEPAT
jgi:uncharacterized protein (DUF433 family)